MSIVYRSKALGKMHMLAIADRNRGTCENPYKVIMSEEIGSHIYCVLMVPIRQRNGLSRDSRKSMVMALNAFLSKFGAAHKLMRMSLHLPLVPARRIPRLAIICILVPI